jgi:phosphoribosyl-ATP pyrophosphohydrolase/phosphoribosyl-AMP cyclohydrolase
MKLVDAKPDCDGDTILYTVEPAGPACHTGSTTCFGDTPFRLADLERVIAARQADPDPDTYTTRLLGDENYLFTKISEEAAEVLKAVRKAEGDRRLAEETADLLYHTLVLLRAQGVRLADVEQVLCERHAVNG